MCIAEALLRIPDDATADRLIAEKLATGDWSSHAGRSESLFVNASTWGLMLTGGILDLEPAIREDAGGWLRKLTRKAGEPVVRLAVRRAMRIIGGEFVVGRTIEEALERSAREADLSLCSFDMLGEGARTAADAARYQASYTRAIGVIGAASRGKPPHQSSSISVKLSALEPRYSLLQHDRVMQRLVPKVALLATQSARLGILPASLHQHALELCAFGSGRVSLPLSSNSPLLVPRLHEASVVRENTSDPAQPHMVGYALTNFRACGKPHLQPGLA